MIKPLKKIDEYKAHPGDLPIGVFDSGLGGLTVVKQLFAQMPYESIIYFGDTARVPYGSKSVSTVQKFSLQIAQFLQEKGIKMIIIACNTASSVALDLLKEAIDLPIVGVIEPGVRAALSVSNRKRIGIIGTTVTVATGKYERMLKEMDPDVQVHSVPCPLFVPLVEEGWASSSVTEEVARIYLKPLIDSNIDTLILGCTHYPLIKSVLQKVLGSDIKIVDTAIETAVDVRRVLIEQGLLKMSPTPPSHRFFVTDFPQKFEEIADRFLGYPLPNVEHVSLGD